MSGKQGYYALVQFSPEPDRYEFVNIGVALFGPDHRYVGSKFSRSLRRVERLFGRQIKGYFEVLKHAFARRLEVEFARGWNQEKLERFAKSRANNIRISQLLPIVVEDPTADLDDLFTKLVGENGGVTRQPKVELELRRKFDRAGVAAYLQKPDPIVLPEGIVIDAPYGYRNGVYNLIDPVRLSGDPRQALERAGRRAIEGQWLHLHSREIGNPKNLIVVGELSGQEPAFAKAVSKMMADHDVVLFDMRNVEQLVDDIRRNAPKNRVGTDNSDRS